MRLALVASLAVAAALGCHGARPASHSAPPAVAKGFPATRWVPANPTYVLASPTVKQAQRSLRDVIDSLGVIGGVDVAEVSRDLARLLAVDPLSPDPVAGMGIDLDGGIAVFSEDVAPTFVVHLTSPEATQAFFDRQRERGLVTQSVIAEGTEIFTAQLLVNVKVSWAVANDWLWVHFSLPFTHDDAQAWFTNSHRPEGPGWSNSWQWASAAAGKGTPSLVGFLDAHDLIASFVGKVPDAMACAKLLDPVRRVAISIEGDGKHVAGRLTLEIGQAAAGVAAAILPGPAGFAGVASTAPIAAQWNVDLLAVRAWLVPCVKTFGGADLTLLDRYGVRTARAVLQSFDPDQKTGAGAVSLDLAHKRYFASRLDDIPLRGTLERSRTFGPHQGHSLSIPFVASIDYVLTDSLALAAVGDGLLQQVVGSGAMTKGPIAAIDLQPPGLSPDAWKLLFEALDLGRADRMVERLLRWRDGHIAVTVEGGSLVLAASGNRR